MTGVREMRGSLSRRAYLAEARTYLPWLRMADVRSAPAGVRAQAVDATAPRRRLPDQPGRPGDVDPQRAVPGGDASMAIAEHIVASL